ncbi:MAG: hypothetical protein QG657_2467 [Acidobacteriota bacterium]|nr:hypothetical protein [Acidobacteriota bacterium]
MYAAGASGSLGPVFLYANVGGFQPTSIIAETMVYLNIINNQLIDYPAFIFRTFYFFSCFH